MGGLKSESQSKKYRRRQSDGWGSWAGWFDGRDGFTTRVSCAGWRKKEEEIFSPSLWLAFSLLNSGFIDLFLASHWGTRVSCNLQSSPKRAHGCSRQSNAVHGVGRKSSEDANRLLETRNAGPLVARSTSIMMPPSPILPIPPHFCPVFCTRPYFPCACMHIACCMSEQPQRQRMQSAVFLSPQLRSSFVLHAARGKKVWKIW